MEIKLWRKVLDRYLIEGKMEADHYADLDEMQQQVIQEIKKSIKRIENKNDKELCTF